MPVWESCRGRREGSERQSVQFGLFVDGVFAGIAEAVVELARFLGEGPDEAFAGRDDSGFTAEDGVLIGERGVDPLPAGLLEGGQYVGEDEGVEGVVMHEQGVADIAPGDVDGQLAVKGGAIKEMVDEKVAVGIQFGGGVESIGIGEAVKVALIDVPIAGIDGDVSDAVAAFAKKFAEQVALFRGVAFFQERVAEKTGSRVIGSDDLFVLEKIYGEIGVAGRGIVVGEMRVSVTADEMPGAVPGGKKLRASSVRNAHATDEQSGADVARGDGLEDAGVGVGPAHGGFEIEPWIIHGEGQLRGRSLGVAG